MTDRAAAYARFRDEALRAPELSAEERAEFRGAIAREIERHGRRREPQAPLEFQVKSE